MVRCRLTQPIEASLKSGNPWIFYDAIRHPNSVRTGDVVEVLDTRGEFLGRGVIEPDNPVRVRLWTLRQDVEVNDALLRARLKAALKRRPYPNGDTDGFRLCNGEGDRIPGLTIDVYGDVAVMRVDGRAAERWLAPATETLGQLLGIKHIAERRSERYRGERPVAQWATGSPPDEVVFRENGLRYLCRPIDGQKTGFFLDQRDNRARVARLATGRRVLNLFGYTGGFSVAAAAAGAARTTTVDLAGPALEDAKRNFELNEIPWQAHAFERADVFDFLASFDRGKAPYDVLICDPPSFAHRRTDLERATEAYVRLFARTLEVAHDDAVVALASCSSQIDRKRFEALVAAAAEQAEVSFVMSGIWGAATDHCWPAGFPEADYLQFALGTVHRD